MALVGFVLAGRGVSRTVSHSSSLLLDCVFKGDFIERFVVCTAFQRLFRPVVFPVGKIDWTAPTTDFIPNLFLVTNQRTAT